MLTPSVDRDVIRGRATRMNVVRDRITDRGSVLETIVDPVDRLRADRARSSVTMMIMVPAVRHPVDHAVHVRKWDGVMIVDIRDLRRAVGI